MVDLTLHWADPTHLEKQLMVRKNVRILIKSKEALPPHPVIGLIMFLCTTRIRYFMTRIISLDEILQNTCRLKELDLGTVFQNIGQSRDASIWVDGKKPGLFVFYRSHIQGDQSVRKPELLKRDRDLMSIWRHRRVQRDLALCNHVVDVRGFLNILVLALEL